MRGIAAIALLSAFAFPATAQTRKNDASAPFSDAEALQFFHTVQTQAVGWKEAVTSIENSSITQEKSALVSYLDDIAGLHPTVDKKLSAAANSLTVLSTEFWLFNDICEFKDGVGHLSSALRYDPNGPDLFNAAVLIQIYTEAQTAKNTLFGEIMHRIVTAATHTVISGQKRGMN
jgi:hypothetical protein